tara:strand:+ start:13246 stop:13386 length:141 start_codon:yes stop_codon:yes gene_type:complete
MGPKQERPEVEVTFKIAERRLAEIKVGQLVNVSVAAYDDRSFPRVP